MISTRFVEEKDGEARIIPFFAKRARGMLARWAIDKRAVRAADLRGFDAAGYRYVAELSSDTEFTFARPQPPPVTPNRKRKD